MRLWKRKTPKPPVRRGPSGRVIRDLVTPEGVALSIQIADLGERAGALTLDLLFMFVAMIVMVIGASLIAGLIGTPIFGLLSVILLLFLLRNFYFTFFEIRWNGQTPGKRILKLLVVNRSGGRLTTDAIFARNLMREIEIFLPMTLLGLSSVTGIATWTVIGAVVWVGILVLMPFFNRDNLRTGDLIAGTIVVHKPATLLLRDVAGAPAKLGAAPTQQRFVFSQAQLDVYGIYELQTLEAVLRRDRSQSYEAERAVAEKIAKKIKWRGEDYHADLHGFLNAYYVALRNRLESQMLLGRRRESKHDAA